jgi:hypothetical protein
VPNFLKFYKKELTEHKIEAIEYQVIGHYYAGTIDLITIDAAGHKHIWDWKTSKAVNEHHKTQVSAYAHLTHADFAHVVIFPEYPLTKQGYSLTTLDAGQIDEHFEMFKFYLEYFKRTVKEPKFKSLPIEISIEEDL